MKTTRLVVKIADLKQYNPTLYNSVINNMRKSDIAYVGVSQSRNVKLINEYGDYTLVTNKSLGKQITAFIVKNPELAFIINGKKIINYTPNTQGNKITNDYISESELECALMEAIPKKWPDIQKASISVNSSKKNYAVCAGGENNILIKRKDYLVQDMEDQNEKQKIIHNMVNNCLQQLGNKQSKKEKQKIKHAKDNYTKSMKTKLLTALAHVKLENGFSISNAKIAGPNEYDLTITLLFANKNYKIIIPYKKYFDENIKIECVTPNGCFHKTFVVSSFVNDENLISEAKKYTQEKILSGDFIVVDWCDNSSFQEHEKTLYKLADNYNNFVNQQWLNGIIKKSKLTKKCNLSISIHDGCIIYENGAGKITDYGNNWSIEYSKKYSEYLEQTKSKLYQRCVDFAINEFSDFMISIDHNQENHCSGILNGDTALNIYYGRFSITYLYQTGSWEESVQEWKKTLRKNKKEIVQKFDDMEAEYTEELHSKLVSFYNSILQQDIYKFVKENQKYITTTATVQAMRGTTISLYAQVELTEHCGCYSFIPAETVKKAVNQMISAGIIIEKELKGRYGYFNILKINPDYDNLKIKKPEDIKGIIKSFANGSYIGDNSAIGICNHILKKDVLEMSDYLDLVKIMESNPHVCCVNLENYHDVFANAPKEVIKFVKMKKSMVDDSVMKKIYIAILKK